MPKVYLSPALHAYDNPCSYDKKCGENIHCGKLMDQLIPYLDACGIEWKRSNPKNTGKGYAKTIAESNAFKPDVHFVMHTNACASHKAVGSRIYVHPESKAKELAVLILKHRKEFYPDGGKVVENTTLTEILNNIAPCVYDETVFHDNVDDATFLHENIKAFAEADAKALCEYFGIPFVDPYATTKKPEKAPVKKPASKPAGYNPEVERWQKAAIADGFELPSGADGIWGQECESVAKKALVMMRDQYLYPNLTAFVQEKVSATVDGKCGPETDKAIRKLQNARGLGEDGIAGPDTYKEMVKT
jgi:N-acetylmuramoyl-L-alanine amidase